jgi:fatty-acid desaturase
MRWRRDNIVGFAFIHAIALLAFLPFFFSWTGVWLLGAGLFAFEILGINLCFHRLLAHRSFACPYWLEHSLAILGTCALQNSPPHWVAVHRRHHEFADEDGDPHSPVVNFFWAHMGWLLVKAEDMSRRPLIQRYAKDIIRDPLYMWIDRHNNWMKIGFGVWIGYFALGFGFMMLAGHSYSAAVQFGLSLLVWGGALRTVVAWHVTWSVNSISHVWGYRNYETPDTSRNNALIAILAAGEGWHNNHHADSRSARHGHEWWEIDVTWMIIRLLALFGFARDVATPSAALKARSNSSRGQDSNKRAGVPIREPDYVTTTPSNAAGTSDFISNNVRE